MSRDRLSEKAQEVVSELEEQISKIVNADKVREPKLTKDEREAITELESIVKEYKPWVEKLGEQLEATDQRLKDLKQFHPDLIFSGKETIESVTADLIRLPVLLNVLDTAFVAAMGNTNSAIGRINQIKDNAREEGR